MSFGYLHARLATAAAFGCARDETKRDVDPSRFPGLLRNTVAKLMLRRSAHHEEAPVREVQIEPIAAISHVAKLKSTRVTQ